MDQFLHLISRLVKEEEGATVVEYAVLISLIIAGVVVIIGVLGEQIKNGFALVNTRMTAVGM